MKMIIGACISFSQDNPEETRSPERDLSDEQRIDDEVQVKENNPEQQSEDWELEELSNQNKLHRPYRDTKSHVTENNVEDDVTSQSSSVTASSMDSREIRTRVKKSLDKKQRDMRRRKRGEASAVTRSRRENRDAVKYGAQSWHDGWWLSDTRESCLCTCWALEGIVVFCIVQCSVIMSLYKCHTVSSLDEHVIIINCYYHGRIRH